MRSQPIRPLTLADLGGVRPTPAELESALREIPLDAALGFLAARSLELAQAGGSWGTSPSQLPWIKEALEDSPLSTAAVPEEALRDPRSDYLRPLLHEHNIAWLAMRATRHCRRGEVTGSVAPYVRRLCRLLLVANDYLSDDAFANVGDTLLSSRENAAELLRYRIFNRFNEDVGETMRRLARQRTIFRILETTYMPAVATTFRDAAAASPWTSSSTQWPQP